MSLVAFTLWVARPQILVSSWFLNLYSWITFALYYSINFVTSFLSVCFYLIQWLGAVVAWRVSFSHMHTWHTSSQLHVYSVGHWAYKPHQFGLMVCFGKVVLNALKLLSATSSLSNTWYYSINVLEISQIQSTQHVSIRMILWYCIMLKWKILHTLINLCGANKLISQSFFSLVKLAKVVSTTKRIPGETNCRPWVGGS